MAISGGVSRGAWWVMAISRGSFQGSLVGNSYFRGSLLGSLARKSHPMGIPSWEKSSKPYSLDLRKMHEEYKMCKIKKKIVVIVVSSKKVNSMAGGQKMAEVFASSTLTFLLDCELLQGFTDSKTEPGETKGLSESAKKLI